MFSISITTQCPPRPLLHLSLLCSVASLHVAVLPMLPLCCSLLGQRSGSHSTGPHSDPPLEPVASNALHPESLSEPKPLHVPSRIPSASVYYWIHLIVLTVGSMSVGPGFRDSFGKMVVEQESGYVVKLGKVCWLWAELRTLSPSWASQSWLHGAGPTRCVSLEVASVQAAEEGTGRTQ